MAKKIEETTATPAPAAEDLAAQIGRLESELQALPARIADAQIALHREIDDEKLAEGFNIIEMLKLKQKTLRRQILHLQVEQKQREFAEEERLHETLPAEIEAAEVEMLGCDSITGRQLAERKIKTLRNRFSHTIFNRSQLGAELQALRRQEAQI